MTDPAYGRVTATGPGLTEDEARGFQTAFLGSFGLFTVIAIIAHFLVWQWRPWIPGTAGYPVRTTQSAPAVGHAPTTVATTAR